MKNIVILAAIQREFNEFKAKYPQLKSVETDPYPVFSGSIHGHSVISACSGCGKVRAAACTQYLISKTCPDFLIHFGTAGAIDPNLIPGDLILGTQSLEIDYKDRMDTNPEIPKSSPDKQITDRILDLLQKSKITIHKGTIVTHDCDVVSSSEKKALFKKWNASCTCWEGAAVGRICNLNNIPYVQMRGITDTADNESESAMDFNNNVLPVSKSLVQLIDLILSNF